MPLDGPRERRSDSFTLEGRGNDIVSYTEAALSGGEIKGFTGIDDPYETPLSPELVLKAADKSPERLVDEVLAYLQQQGICRFEQQGAPLEMRLQEVGA